MTTDPLASRAGLTEAERFELLVTSVKDYAIYMLDTAGIVVSWNAGAQRFKGYTASEITGKHFSVFYTEEDRAAGIPEIALRSAIDSGTFEAEGWRVRKDGSSFWASVVIDPIRDASGVLVGFAKITRDISEKRAAQEALRESEEQFRRLVQGVTDYAIYMLTPQGEVASWNEGARRIKQYEREEIVGKHFSCFYTEADRANGMPTLTLAVAAKEGRMEREGWRVRKDGSRFWAHAVVDAIHSDTGELVGFAKVTRDITERKEAEDALQRADAALVHSQKMEALGQVTGGVAHDFNNLLAILSNGLQVLASQSRTHLDTKMIQTMERAVDRGAALTQQLLSFARQQPLKTEKLQLNALIRAFEPMLLRVGSNAITFEVKLNAKNSTVLLDAARFEAALLNLVANARDAMPKGGAIAVGTDFVELARGEVGSLPAGAYVKVTIADTGAGMPEAVRARAFEPFFTTKAPGKGTGLGLSQVYGFISQSGGEAVIQSIEGHGTAINLYLPALEEEVGNAKGYASDLAVETVLLVEDEPDLLGAAVELFRSIGYEVVTSANAQEALAILQQNQEIDIVFSDIVLGLGMNGIELARMLERDYPSLKVVLASGYPLAALREDHGELSDFTFVHKPYRLADLAKALRA